VLSLSAVFAEPHLAHAEPRARAAKDPESPKGEIEQSSESTEDRRAQAQQLYEQAARAYAARKNFEAIELFRQSGEFEPSPLLDYNMALAYEEAGDVRNALKYYRQYLANATRADDAGEVRTSIAKLEHQLAGLGIQQLTVTSVPSGATVFLDGSAAGVTPFTGEFVPGTHALTVKLEGHAEARIHVEIPKAHSLEVPLRLEKHKPEPAAVATPKPRSVRSDRSSLSRVQPLSLGLLGVGVGSLGAGILFELSRAKSSEQSRTAESAIESAEARGAADGKQLASLVLLGAGGALVITGGVLALLDLNRTEPQRTNGVRTRQSALASAGCLPGFCGVELRGLF
jgi:tetratricopeptide (TPR) repeat protein